MPKFPTFPTLYDLVKSFSISELKEWGYLKSNQWKSGEITWSRDGNITGTISISVNCLHRNPCLELNYRYKDILVNYKINLVSIPSNLGIGKIWYFLCPQTKKRCRKLYLVEGKFLHREAFKHCFYDIQTMSHKDRRALKLLKEALADKAYEKLYSKHFKSHYKGQPTKRYLRLMKKINESAKFSVTDIERLYIS